MRSTVPVEALAVGIILVIIFAIIHSGMMVADQKFSMSHMGIFLGVLLAGAIGHVGLELVGANEKFCKVYDKKAE